MVAFSTVIPVIISLMVWRTKGEDEATKDVKNLASQLSEVANKSEIVINAIGDGVMAIDSQGIVQLINPAGQEILGWAKQDALMLNYKSILKMVDANGHEFDPANDPVQQVLNTNQEVRANSLTIITKSEKKITGSIVVSPVGDAGNGVIAVFRDVTKEKAEEREQAEFISTASHEMRTPVASIEGYLGLALNPQTSKIDDKAREFITKAHEAAQHLGRLFQDLLDVSKSEDGRMTNIPKVVDMTQFTQTIVEGLTAKAKRRAYSSSTSRPKPAAKSRSPRSTLSIRTTTTSVRSSTTWLRTVSSTRPAGRSKSM
jgi:PAS domain S-box-containing protein